MLAAEFAGARAGGASTLAYSLAGPGRFSGRVLTLGLGDWGSG